MRVNVYAEEITDRVEIIEKIADTGSHFYGVRFYLKTHEDMLPPNHPDDDSSGVTFWVKSSKQGYEIGDEKFLSELLSIASRLLKSLVLYP